MIFIKSSQAMIDAITSSGVIFRFGRDLLKIAVVIGCLYVWCDNE